MISNQGILSNKWLLPLMVITIAAVALAFWAMTSNQAQASEHNLPDAKNAMLSTEDFGITTDIEGDGSHPLMSGWIHTSNQKTLAIDVSIECGLMTKTKVKSKGGHQDGAGATATVVVEVYVDDELARPGKVVFCDRTQELTAKFQGMIDKCTSFDDVLDEACLTDEELTLVLNTTAANAFNFIQDVGQGDHKIEVMAHISSSVAFTGTANGEATAMGIIGKGTAVVTEVREIK